MDADRRGLAVWTTFRARVAAPVCLALLARTAFAQIPVQPSLSAALTAGRSAPFVHESFQLTLTVTAHGVRLGQAFSLQGVPDSSVLQLAAFRELPAERRQQGNALTEVRRFICDVRPMQPGAVRFAPSLRCGILSRRWSFFGPTDEETPTEIRVAPLSLNVKPLPEAGRPPGFSGAVGQFAFDAEAKPLDVAVGDLITVTARIQGRGYLDDVPAPEVSAGRHFKLYPARATPPRSEDTREFQQILVPQSTNAVEISAVAFSFFDPAAATYRTITRGPFRVRFHASVSQTIQPYRPPVSTQAVAHVRIGGVVLRGPDLSRRAVAFHLAYWCAAALIMIGAAFRSRRKLLAATLAALLAAAAFLPARALVNRMVFAAAQSAVLRDGSARLAPAYSAIETFPLPKGSAVRVLESYGGWSKIEIDGKRGWVPDENLGMGDRPPPHD